MRKFWIDTDAASDDALAIMMALRHPDIDVVGISLVSGYRPVSAILYNPALICHATGVSTPPVFPGSELPYGFVPSHPPVFVHGNDGLGDLPRPDLSNAVTETVHACDGLLAAANRYPGELEVIALGPLSNLAFAFRKDPGAAQKLKVVYIMGGTGHVPGNVSPVAEANIWGDAEAAQAVLTSGARCILIGLDAAGGDMFYDPDDLERLAVSGKAGRWFVDTSHNMIDFLATKGLYGLSQPDPAAMGIALWPDLELQGNDAHCEVECRGALTLGMVVEDITHNPTHNCHVVHKMDGATFKQRVLDLLHE